jgi:hypothetical protein
LIAPVYLGHQQRIAFPQVFEAALKLRPSSVYPGTLLFKDLVAAGKLLKLNG